MKWGGRTGLGTWSSENGSKKSNGYEARVLEAKMGQGEIRIRVLVWGYTKGNSISLLDRALQDLAWQSLVSQWNK